MPIEIKEMHIKISVGDGGNSPSLQNTDESDGKDEIIEACVEQVMEILSKKEER